MKYIELRPGLKVKKDQILSIEDIDMMSCKILTPVGAYESIYPSWRILMLLEQPDIEELIADKPQISDRVNLWGNQHYAG